MVVRKIKLVVLIFIEIFLLHRLVYYFIVDKRVDKAGFVDLNSVFREVYCAMVVRIYLFCILFQLYTTRFI